MSKDNPETYAEWWDYIKTDDDDKKIAYFLRNYAAIAPRGKCVELLEFLGTKAKLVFHRPGRCASLETSTKTWILRIDPTTPTTRGPVGYPSMVVCW